MPCQPRGSERVASVQKFGRGGENSDQTGNTSSRLSSSTPRRTGRRSDCSHALRARSKPPRLAAQLQRAPPEPPPATAADVSWAPEWAPAVAAPTCGPPARAPQEAQAKPGSPRAVAAAARAKRRAARASSARLAKVSAGGRVGARRWVGVHGRGGWGRGRAQAEAAVRARLAVAGLRVVAAGLRVHRPQRYPGGACRRCAPSSSVGCSAK